MKDFNFRIDRNVQDGGESELVCAGFATGAARYACTPEALRRGAIKRLLSVRENDIDHHIGLVENQARCALGAGPRKFKREFHARVEASQSYQALLEEWVEMPHPKRKLRQSCRSKAESRGRPLVDSRKYVDYKLKPGELLKPENCQMRTIGEISDLSAFEHGPVAALQKEVFAEPFYYRNGVAVFIPGPREENMRLAYEVLTSTQRRVNYIYFSDDSCISVKCEDGIYFANLDLSWSDGSMFYPEFEFAIETLAVGQYEQQVRNAFKQCQKPIRLINRNAGKRDATGKKVNRRRLEEFIEIPLRAGHYVLASGFSGTTIMNNFSQIMFFSEIANAFNRRSCRKNAVADRILQAAKRAGLTVKVLECETIEGLQFLKHSWAIDESTGEYAPYVNLACWLRGFGIIKGHLPGKKGWSLERRFRAFNAEVTFARANWGSTPLSDAFQDLFPESARLTGFERYQDNERLRTGLVKNRKFTTESVCKRYGFSEAELLNFCDLFRESGGFGVYIYSDVVSKIMQKDYGYSSICRVEGHTAHPKFCVRNGKKVRYWDEYRPPHYVHRVP